MSWNGAGFFRRYYRQQQGQPNDSVIPPLPVVPVGNYTARTDRQLCPITLVSAAITGTELNHFDALVFSPVQESEVLIWEIYANQSVSIRFRAGAITDAESVVTTLWEDQGFSELCPITAGRGTEAELAGSGDTWTPTTVRVPTATVNLPSERPRIRCKGGDVLMISNQTDNQAITIQVLAQALSVNAGGI